MIINTWHWIYISISVKLECRDMRMMMLCTRRLVFIGLGLMHSDTEKRELCLFFHFKPSSGGMVKSIVGIDLVKGLEGIKNKINFELKHNLMQFIKLSSAEVNGINSIEGVDCNHLWWWVLTSLKRMIILFHLPGGKWHLDKTAVQTAQRELYEETSLLLPIKKDGKEKLIYFQGEDESKGKRFFICKPLSNKCTTLMELIPKWKSKQRCRICLQNKNQKSPRQSCEHCLGCRETVCAECFKNYDHNPTSRKQISHHKRSKFTLK